MKMIMGLLTNTSLTASHYSSYVFLAKEWKLNLIKTLRVAHNYKGGTW